MRFWLLIFLFGIARFSVGQTDFTHLNLLLEADTNLHSIQGKLMLKYLANDSTDSVYLNAVKIDFHSFLHNGVNEEYFRDENGLWFFPEPSSYRDTNIIEIEYTAYPRKGLYFTGWHDSSHISPRQIWTQGQGIDHRHWIPHKDDQTDKLLIEIQVIFNSKYQVISNGVLLDTTAVGDGNTKWHYKMSKPMSSYLIALVIGEYAVRRDTVLNVPAENYFYPRRAEDYPWYYYKNEEIFRFVNEEIGMTFPWANYKQVPVQDFRHGAMENTTATIFGDFFLVDEIAFNDRNYTYVNAHELAHQWFGNLLTAESAEHHWLHEGFATYYQWLSEKHLYGQDYFDHMRWQEAELVFDASRADTLPLAHPRAGTYRFYQKGAWLLYMLNEQLGETVFRQGIAHYLRKHQFGVVNSDDFQKSMEWAGKTDLNQFFKDWLYGVGEPRIIVEQQNTSPGELSLKLQQQTLGEEPMHLPVSIELIYHDGERELRSAALYTEDIGHRYKLKGELLYWNYDPGRNLLAHIREIKPRAMWLAQLADPQMPDRLEAMRALAAMDEVEDKVFLEVFQRDTEHFSVRAVALEALLQAGESRETYLKQALQDKDVQLQKKAVKMVAPTDRGLHALLKELALRGRSYELREQALHQAAATGPLNHAYLKESTFAKEAGIPGRNVEISSLAYRWLLFQDASAAGQLIEYSAPAYDFLTRMNAMQTITALNLQNARFYEYVMEAFFHTNWKLSREARTVLQTYYQTEEGRQWVAQYTERQAAVLLDFQKQMLRRTFELNIP